MEIVRDQAQLERYITEAVVVSGDSPVLLDSYLSGAIEVDVDALCDGTTSMWRASCSISKRPACIRATAPARCRPIRCRARSSPNCEAQTKALALALNVVGLMNVQFAVKDDTVYLIEVNPRASRTVPFVAKAVSSPIAAIAARLMAGRSR